MKLPHFRTSFQLRHSLICVCLFAALSASAQQSERFISNDQYRFVNSEQLKKLRAAWKNAPMSLLGESKVGENDLEWVLDLIAFTHGETLGRCEDLTLIKIEKHPLAAFKIFEDHSKKITTYRPKKYLEAWHVKACGQNVEWRVVDDPDNTGYQEVTPLLWKFY